MKVNEDQEEQKRGYIKIETKDKESLLMHTSMQKAYFCEKDNRQLSLPRDQAFFLLRILYGELIDVQVW